MAKTKLICTVSFIKQVQKFLDLSLCTVHRIYKHEGHENKPHHERHLLFSAYFSGSIEA